MSVRAGQGGGVQAICQMTGCLYIHQSRRKAVNYPVNSRAESSPPAVRCAQTHQTAAPLGIGLPPFHASVATSRASDRLTRQGCGIRLLMTALLPDDASSNTTRSTRRETSARRRPAADERLEPNLTRSDRPRYLAIADALAEDVRSDGTRLASFRDRQIDLVPRPAHLISPLARA
jgi:hypothetical protein